jgi:Lon-like ATP-dependent protease
VPLHGRARTALPYQTAHAFSTTPHALKDRSRDKPAPPEGDSPVSSSTDGKKDKGQAEAPAEKEVEAENEAPEPKPKREPSKRTTDQKQAAKEADEAGNAPSSAAAAAGGSAGSGSDGGSSGGAAKKVRRTGAERSLSRQTVPDVYPQVLAIPITKRPLFPGFYKVITIKDPEVSKAITESFTRGQPYVGAFLVKDRAGDETHHDDFNEDVIRNLDDVHDVGVFAQVTSILPIAGQKGAITAVLYPHRRIRLSGLVTSAPGSELDQQTDSSNEAEVPDPIPAPKAADEDAKGDVVASFEESAVARPERRLAAQQQQQQSSTYDPTSFLRNYNVSLGNVENLTEEPFDGKSQVVRAVTNEIVNVFKEVALINSLFRDQIATFSISQSAGNVISEPARLADFAAAVSSGDREELQGILASLDVEERLQKALIVLKKELLNAQLQAKITKEVENKIGKRQREYWLMEQMKGIRRELGIESDGKDKLVEKFKAKADSLAMPEAARKVFDEEVAKLATLETAASEFNVTRNYLDWLTQIPWGLRSAENFGIANARRVLDEDHYGLDDVKDRILEFIAVGKLRGTVEGKILCFVGPPGVGTTSIGKSIARALNRQYYRFSVGGLTDVAEIKGHRRTYVGALPGRMIQALKKCQTENPLVLIDEIDKIGRGWQGDPSSALLELLDPEQNGSFLDHYMDVPVDLSKVLFVCTANMTDTIPRPLLDRMELITLSGYVAAEKVAIAERYLGPTAKDAAGLGGADVTLTRDGIEELIKSYCRESGVRNLKKQIEKVYRKSALKIVQDLGEAGLPEEQALTEEGRAALEEDTKKDGDASKASATASSSPSSSSSSSSSASSTTPSTTTPVEAPRVPLAVPDTVHVHIGRDNLKDYVGPPVFTADRLYDVNPVGVAMGLAWTQMGGAAMYVEAILKAPLRPHSRPELEITGNLKQVMKESSSIAHSYTRSFMLKHFPENHFFDRARLHLHFPDGAVPKDGPSAGITMTTSLLSLGLDAEVDPNVAMTGELTLTGKVLRIGGLREKTVAARRAGCKMIIFPQDNMSDWLELPEVCVFGEVGVCLVGSSLC